MAKKKIQVTLPEDILEKITELTDLSYGSPSVSELISRLLDQRIAEIEDKDEYCIKRK
jgi:metal-responsive CopG/Arc/MetJ family transcriptional regulator